MSGEFIQTGELRVVMNNGELGAAGKMKTREQFEAFTSLLFQTAGLLWPEAQEAAPADKTRKKYKHAKLTPPTPGSFGEQVLQLAKAGQDNVAIGKALKRKPQIICIARSRLVKLGLLS